jgi:uncharacterized protein (DUF2147 family)
MSRLLWVAVWMAAFAVGPALAAGSVLGTWHTLDDTTGKVYKAELRVEHGKLKVRGYQGILYKTKTWRRGR